MNFSLVWLLFLAVLANTGRAQVSTRTGACVPIDVVMPPAAQLLIAPPAGPAAPGLYPLPVLVVPPAGGGAHVVANVPGAGAGGAAGGGAAIGGGVGGPRVVPGGGDVAVPVQAGAGTWANIVNWLRGLSNNAVQSARAIGTQGNQLVHAHPYAVTATVTVVAATAAYQYTHSVLEYVFQDTRCYMDGREDYLAMLRVSRPNAATTHMDAWSGVWMGVEVCRTGFRPIQAGVEALVMNEIREEREERERRTQEQEQAEQERRRQEQQASTEEPHGTKTWNSADATREAIRKHGKQGEQLFDGTHGAGQRLEDDQDKESSKAVNDEVEEPVASQVVTMSVEVWLVLVLPVVVLIFAGHYWGWTFVCYIKACSLKSLEKMLWKCTRFDALERSARAGYLTNSRDLQEYQTIQPYIVITKCLQSVTGAIIAFQLVRAVYGWVARRYPAWRMVVSINNFVNRVPSMDTISARARGIVWHLCCTLIWPLRELLIATGFLRRTPAEIREREAAEQRRGRRR